MEKSTFKGAIISIQPRIRLTRSFDEASHTYLGYAITLEGEIDDQNTTFSVGIGKAAHAKHQFKKLQKTDWCLSRDLLLIWS